MKKVYTIRDEKELDKLAALLLKLHRNQRIFAFYGELGAGKTTFIKSFCKLLEVEDTVQSPSFSLINEYKTRDGILVYHMDFYRITKLEEVFDIGYEDYLFSGHYCLIEWSERIESLLPEDIVRIHILVEHDHSRTILVS